jgi:hypothetical protein
MFNCLVIGRENMERLVPDLESHAMTGEVFCALRSSGIERIIAKEHVDIVFIRLRDWSYERCKILYKIQNPPHVVFISAAKDHYVDDVYDIVRFHLKDAFSPKALDHVLQQVKSAERAENIDFVLIKHKHRYVKIRHSEITLLEKKSFGIMSIHTAKAEYPIHGTIKRYAKTLPKGMFEQVAINLIIPINAKEHVRENGFMHKAELIPFVYRKKLTRNTKGQFEITV